MTRKIPASVAEELFKVHERAGGYRYVADKHIDTSRWMKIRQVIIADDDDDFWVFDYKLGLTEYQENDYPWDGRDEVEIYPVYPRAQVVIEYVRKQ